MLVVYGGSPCWPAHTAEFLPSVSLGASKGVLDAGLAHCWPAAIQRVLDAAVMPEPNYLVAGLPHAADECQQSVCSAA